MVEHQVFGKASLTFVWLPIGNMKYVDSVIERLVRTSLESISVYIG